MTREKSAKSQNTRQRTKTGAFAPAATPPIKEINVGVASKTGSEIGIKAELDTTNVRVGGASTVDNSPPAEDNENIQSAINPSQGPEPIKIAEADPDDEGLSIEPAAPGKPAGAAMKIQPVASEPSAPAVVPYDADKDRTITALQIRQMSVIQIHHYVGNNLEGKAASANLLEIYDRNRLQAGLIAALGL